MLSIFTEALATAALLAIVVLCLVVSLREEEGLAGGAIRMVATLLLPALALGFTHSYFWPLSLLLSAILAAIQFRSRGNVYRSRANVWSGAACRPSIALIPVGFVCVLLSIKAALALATTPYDIDSNDYHLPMSIEYLQTHTTVPAQLMFHPGNAELLDSIGLGALGAVGGQTLTEAVVALALFLAAGGIARRLGATRAIALAAASATIAIPIVADQLFTAQNDVLVAALLLALAAVWARFPTLGAIAFGLAAGTKFTGALEAAVLIAVLWPQRSTAFTWRHGALAICVAAPWYIRNAIETGNPLFLGAQTSGFSSTIAAHAATALPFVLTAVRNYGGLLAVLGIFSIIALSRGSNPTQRLVRSLPSLVVVALAVWLLTPNTAETAPGTLDQIRSGWSIRYLIFALALLNIASIVWLSGLNELLAIGVATIFCIATSLREYQAALHIDPGALWFTVPCFIALALVASCTSKSRVRVLLGGCGAAAFFAVAATVGGSRISAVWDERYAGRAVLGSYSFGSALTLAVVRNARRAATIQLSVLPLVGPRFDCYDVADWNGLDADRWWRTIQAERPEAIIARDMRAAGGLSADERSLRASRLYEIAFRSGGVRVYVPIATR